MDQRESERGSAGWRRAAVVHLLLALAVPAQGQTIQPVGSGWIRGSLTHHDTRDRFDFDGTKRGFFAEGQVVTTSVLFEAELGVTSGLTASVALPFHRFEYTDEGGGRGRTTVGDPRLYLAVGHFDLPGSGIPLFLRAGVKLPGDAFPVDAEIIALGEAQRDWEVAVGTGGPTAEGIGFSAFVGYRWRQEDADRDRDFGDEIFGRAVLDGWHGRFGYELLVEGRYGLTPELQGIRVRRARRNLYTVIPTGRWRVGSGAIDAGISVPLAGQNLPAGAKLSVGYRVGWSGG